MIADCTRFKDSSTLDIVVDDDKNLFFMCFS